MTYVSKNQEKDGKARELSINEYSDRESEMRSVSQKHSYVSLRPKSIISRSSKPSSKVESIRSKIVEFKKKKIIDAINQLDEREIDNLSKTLKLSNVDPSVRSKSVLTEENLDRLRHERTLTEKLNSVKNGKE